MPKVYGCQQVLLNRSLLIHPVLEYLCSQAHRLTNCGIYYGRQVWFKERRYLKKFDLINETYKLKERIKQLCEKYGINFIETEESYTSKASFLDGDELPTFGAKPEGWKPSGRRTKRGLYRTGSFQTINADCNGAANILRKVATTLSLELGRVSRGALTRPTRIKVWVPAKKRSTAALAPC